MVAAGRRRVVRRCPPRHRPARRRGPASAFPRPLRRGAPRAPTRPATILEEAAPRAHRPQIRSGHRPALVLHRRPPRHLPLRPLGHWRWRTIRREVEAVLHVRDDAGPPADAAARRAVPGRPQPSPRHAGRAWRGARQDSRPPRWPAGQRRARRAPRAAGRRRRIPPYGPVAPPSHRCSTASRRAPTRNCCAARDSLTAVTAPLAVRARAARTPRRLPGEGVPARHGRGTLLLVERYDQARRLLWSAPCDLRARRVRRAALPTGLVAEGRGATGRRGPVDHKGDGR